MTSTQAGPKPCRRCNVNEATHKIRTEPTCGACYSSYITMKTVKRLEVLAKEIGAAPTQTKRILVGLSFGASSSSLVNILDESIQNQLRKRPTPAYHPIVVHVDTGLGDDDSSSPESQRKLDQFSERYPRFRFVRVPLTDVLGLDTIDWSALPITPSSSREEDEEGKAPAERLRDFFARLPSTTSRADVERLFIRHLLISAATREGVHALLFGYSTTALAELTLGETAKGRGFSLPWMVDDGPQTIRSFAAARQGGERADGAAGKASEEVVARLPIYYPLREVFRNELTIYTGLVSPPLTDLLISPEAARSGSAVVSHKDVSIDEVMSRYFQDVEENYPSIVANVVRTTAKLERLGDEDGETCCGLCGMGLDELGDERWKGEIGDDGGGEYGRLCYGCQRAMRN
ncbi:Cytoplasmic tRNA 2-thiolation protein 2 [Cytospora mali]|uniref:Cytoplasmic tRNA 2-thiolation protein 2 n=1 Tax=Cytospora mali TaxID=578113 RepID=A0A194V9P4_CYTMA|nr:Cytoplasmic tRNA 2-thiolation protein 2 [Valsa mali var. pyri (nom. inval.)]